MRADLEVAKKYGRQELALDGGILGRVDDMLLIRGVNVFPTAVEDVILSFAEVAEFRVEVAHPGAMADLRVEIEPHPDANAEDLDTGLQPRLRTVLNLRVSVTLSPVGSLPRYEMKAKRWSGVR